MLTLVVILVAAYFGFTKSNPFADPYELHAVVRDAQNLKPGAPVREAGVEVGKVTKVEAADGREPASRGHDGAARRRAAGARGRARADPPAHPARGQLLRRPRAGLVRGRGDRGRRHRADHPDQQRGDAARGAVGARLRHPHRPADAAARVRHGGRRRRRAGAQPRDPVLRARLPAQRADQRRAARRAADRGPAARAAQPGARVRDAGRQPGRRCRTSSPTSTRRRARSPARTPRSRRRCRRCATRCAWATRRSAS